MSSAESYRKTNDLAAIRRYADLLESKNCIPQAERLRNAANEIEYLRALVPETPKTTRTVLLTLVKKQEA